MAIVSDGGIIAGRDLSAASAALTACFGKEGNFTVAVEELSGDTSDDVEVCTEFKVWSSLLAHWSPVLAKMVGSENYAETQKAEVIIRDFSAAAVEMFLRFLYTGSVRGSVSALLEVAALADKYQVQALHALCMRLVREALKPEVACEVFASAYRFHMDDLRCEALDLVFTKPAEALKERPALRPELLEEILSSGLLCIAEDALKRTLQGWGSKDSDRLQPIIEARIQLATVRTPSVHTEDVLRTLWDRYVRAGKQGAFLGYRVVVMLGPEQSEMCKATQSQVNVMARNDDDEVVTYRRGWVQWLLPHSRVHLRGFSFGNTVSSTASFQIHVKSDESSATWHLAYESYRKEIEEGTFLPCKRPPSLVKHFKLEVLEGELRDTEFQIRGILQTSI